MKALLLAAGFGKRLQPLTETLPKPLVEVGGKPLIQHHIENLVAAGITELVVNLHWLGEKIEAYLGDGSKFGAQIQYSYEVDILETGGGIRHALPLLGEDPFVLLSADIYSQFSYASLAAAAIEFPLEQRLAHLVLVDNPPHKNNGDFCLDFDGKVYLQSDNDLTYSGIAIVNPALIENWPGTEKQFPLRTPLMDAVARGKVTGERYAGLWEDVGTLERLQCLKDLLNKQTD